MKKIILITLFFNIYFNSSALLCFTSLADTSDYSDVFIGKAIKNYSFPSVVGKWVRKKQFSTFEVYNILKGLNSKPDTIAVESLSVYDYPFVVDSVYVVFTSRTCKEKWHLSHLFAKLECSLTSLRSHRPSDEKLATYYDYFHTMDTLNNRILQENSIASLKMKEPESPKTPNYFILSVLFISIISPILLIRKMV